MRLDAPAVAKLCYLSAVLATAWAARSIFSPFQELVKADLGLTDIQMSIVQGAALAVPSIPLSLLAGRLIDTRNRMLLLAVLSGLTMLGSIGTAFSHDFAGLIGYRALAGLGMLEEAVVLSLAADLFAPERRGRANIMIVAGDYAGSSLGFVLAGWLIPVAPYLPFLASHGGWRDIQLLFGLAGFVFSLPLLLIREPRRHECGVAAGLPLREGWRLLWRLRGVLQPLLLAQIAIITAGNVLWVWVLPVLDRRFGLAPAELGAIAATIMPLAALAGALVSGLLVDRQDAWRSGALLIAALACALAIPASFFPLLPALPLTGALLFLLVMTNTAAALCSNTFAVIAIPNDLRGLWFGLSGALPLLVGYAIAPTLVAYLSAAIAGRDALADALAIVLVLCNVIALASYLRAWRQARRSGDRRVANASGLATVL